MTPLLINAALCAMVGFVAGVFARPWIGLAALTAIGAALAGAMFLPDDPEVYQEMSRANQALAMAVVFGVPAFVGWVPGALIRVERQERARLGDAP